MTQPDEPIFPDKRITRLAETMAIPADELEALISTGETHSYPAGIWFFYESMPRLWMGIVEEGEVEIIRGNHSHTTRLATLTRGAAFGEGVLLN